MKSGIYAIVNLLNGRHYVGSAVNLSKRQSTHWAELKSGAHHNCKLQRAWAKYGPDAFRFDVLEQCGRDQLQEREQFFLDKTLPFYNILRKARSAQGFRHSDETKQKTSERTRQWWASLTEEEREARHAAHAVTMTGRTHSDEHKAKIGAWGKGRKMTERQLESFALIKNDPAAIAKRAAAKSKSYIATAPDGTTHRLTNLSQFCRDHNLSQGHMVQVAKGKRQHHKGWACRSLEIE